MDILDRLLDDADQFEFLSEGRQNLNNLYYLDEYGLLKDANSSRNTVKMESLNSDRIALTGDKEQDKEKIKSWLENNSNRRRVFANAYAALLITNQDILGFELNYPRTLFIDYEELKRSDARSVFTKDSDSDVNIRDFDRIIVFSTQESECAMYVLSINPYLESDLYRVGYNLTIYNKNGAPQNIEELILLVTKLFGLSKDYLVRDTGTINIVQNGGVLDMCYYMSQYSKNLEIPLGDINFTKKQAERAISYLAIEIISDSEPKDASQRNLIPPDPYVTEKRLLEAVKYSKQVNLNQTRNAPVIQSRNKRNKGAIFHF